MATDRRSPEAQAWRPFYNTAAWKRRREAQRMAEPLCRHCLAAGKITPMEVADHVKPHKGDWTLFITGELQSLCKPHHDAGKQREEHTGWSAECDATGWPTDARHPVNRPR